MGFKKEDARRVFYKKSKSGSTYGVWVFGCIICNADLNMQSGGLATHSGKCRSCCQKRKPYEHIVNELTYRCINRTNTHITLTYEEFLKIISDRKCHYCSKPLEFSKHTRDANKNYTSRAHQLDRKDNNLGYTKDNVVPCCWECNRLKSDIYSYEEFMIISKALKIVQKNRK